MTESGPQLRRRRFLAAFGLDDSLPTPSAQDAAAYEEWREGTTYNTWTALFFGTVLMTVAWWPTDFLIFRTFPGVIQAFAIARGVTSVVSLFTLFLISRIAFLRRHALLGMVILACANLTLWSYEFGELGDPSTLWFNFMPQLIHAAVLVSVVPTSRVALSCVLAAGLMFGYFGLHPQHLSSPYAPAVLSCLACSVVGSIAGGFMVEHLRQQAFFLRLATERQASLVASMNERLEDRVAEQTGELRALANGLEKARETERTHIARELHDELGQELTALRLALKFARVRYDRDRDSVSGNFEELEALLARTTTTTRNILVDLRPRILDDLGLAAAAEWLVERARQRGGLECVLDMPAGPLVLSPETATVAFRILQEALTNVMRHSQATRVDIKLGRHEDSLQILVRDNGVGFDRTRSPTGLGLVGMRERAQSAGGQLTVESTLTIGTTVDVRLPCGAEPLLESA